MERFLLVLEHDGRGITAPSLRLCANLRRYAGLGDRDVAAVLFGACDASVRKVLGEHGIGRVYLVAGSGEDYLSPEPRVRTILKLAALDAPSFILLTDTLRGRETAPILAVKLDAGLVSGCVQVVHDGGMKEAVIQVYNGQYQMVCRLTGSPHVVVAADLDCGAVEPAGTGEAEGVAVPAPGSSEGPELQVLESFSVSAADLDIDEAGVVIGIGRGVETEEDLRMVADLAAAIGAPVGGTRPAVDAGMVPAVRQIGQTGRVIASATYLAIGISGARQHLCGVEKGKMIAINRDPQAPVLHLADLGVVGDFREVVPLLIKKLGETGRS